MKPRQKGVIFKTFWRVVRVLPRQFKLAGLLSFLMLFLNSALDLLGLGAVVPLLIVLLEEDGISSNKYLNNIYENFEFQSHNSFILAICIFILIVIILKNTLSLGIQFYQANFSYRLQRHFSIILYRSYYRKGFLYFKSLNSANIVRNIQAVPTAFALNIMLPLMSVINEIIMISAIMVGLLIYQFEILVLLALIVGPAFVIFFFGTKRLNRRIAEKQHELMPLVSKNIIESVYGYLDVKVTNTESNFYRRHEDLQLELTGLRTKAQVLKIAPSKILETALFLGVVTIVVYGVYSFETRTELITLLGVFALSAYRIMPSVNRILTGVISLNGFRYILDIIESDADNEVQEEQFFEDLTFENSITVYNLSYRYNHKNDLALDCINVKIKRGESIGLVGKSGSGKSTFLNVILGFLTPSEGSIKIDRQKLCEENVVSWRHHIGYVQQDVYLVDGSVRENVAFGVSNAEINDELIWTALEKASLKDFVSSLDGKLEFVVGERGGNLSGGQRQRIGIARALYAGATILCFDEATSALDNETEQEVTAAINNLQSENLTMIIIAHRISTLKKCDRIFEFENGKMLGEIQYDELVNRTIL